MIAQVFKEFSILLETCLEPGELIWLKLGIASKISRFGHEEMVSPGADRIDALAARS
jgi:hypothetical protein